MREQKLMISFLATNYSALKEHWRKYSVLREKGKRGSDRPFNEDLGGKVAFLDWGKKEFDWEIELDSPSGLLVEEDKLFVNSINQGKILQVDLDRKEVVDEINHPRLNKPHSLIKTNRGFMTASTGLDSIIEVDRLGNTLFEVCLVDCGYNKDQFGEIRTIDRDINHQQIVYPSLRHTTHINFAKYVTSEENIVIATLFHQGEVILLDKNTGQIDVVLKGLSHPHNVNEYSEDNYLICDTDNNRILIVNKDSFAITKEVIHDYSWIQDAVCVDDNIYIADANHHRIVKLDENLEPSDEYVFSEEYRIYQILSVNWE